MNKNKLFILCILVINLLFVGLQFDVIKYEALLGLDFQNLFAFHHCDLLKGGLQKLYTTSGLICGDELNRSMVYPPALYRFFSFTQLFDNYNYAYYTWAGALCLCLLFAIYAWKIEGKFNLALIVLFFYFPFLFAIERGNNDLIIVLCWSLFYIAFKHRIASLAGFFVATAICLKLYPLFAAAPFLLGRLIHDYKQNKMKFSFVKAIILCCIASGLFYLLIDFDLWKEYIFKVIPEWSSSRGGKSFVSHSFLIFFPTYINNLALFIITTMLTILSFKDTSKYKQLSMSACLACTTLFTGVSYDYNLVTTYPFIILVFGYLMGKKLVEPLAVGVIFSLLILVLFGPTIILSNYVIANRLRVIAIPTFILLISFRILKPGGVSLIARLKHYYSFGSF